ncbi:tautomerase family protein [Caballeronia sp. Lep1P3]|uniref:tautomerase family protein n=1 Tax=Caballeronia sp. Lep1P3 TaxID=2878150 RepID=UPI001FD4847F|nr:tautomerase family protein [Caballeronia sp. Lep1P3]
MPLVRIDLLQGKDAAYRATIGDAVYEAMRATLDVPENDRFQIVSEHSAPDFIVDRGYMGISRTDDCIVIQVTLSEGRDIAKKRAFYRAVVDALHERLDMRREDVFINLVEVRKENWSFGNGEAQYAPE